MPQSTGWEWLLTLSSWPPAHREMIRDTMSLWELMWHLITGHYRGSSFPSSLMGQDAPPWLCPGLAANVSFRILQEAPGGLGRKNSCPHTQVQPLLQPQGWCSAGSRRGWEGGSCSSLP